MRMLDTALGAVLMIAAPAAPPGHPGHAAVVAPFSGASVAAQAEPVPPGSPADDPDSGIQLLGTAAPEWSFTRWIGSPLSLAELRGKVVLVRWWTEGCHFCASTLPELETLRRQHAAEGLVVIGVFHPKPPREVSDRHIMAKAKRLGFGGPIAVDREWATLDRYWLAGHPERAWTSVSFLIDRRGLIRWVHGGGEYHQSDDPRHARCVTQFHELQQVLTTVLAEPPEAPGTP